MKWISFLTLNFGVHDLTFERTHLIISYYNSVSFVFFFLFYDIVFLLYLEKIQVLHQNACEAPCLTRSRE